MKTIVNWLLRIGLLSRHHTGKLHWPIHISPWHWWWFLIRHGDWPGRGPFQRFGVFRNTYVHPWYVGRFLPWRWGFFALGLEVGDRGSHWAPRDETRRSLWRRA